MAKYDPLRHYLASKPGPTLQMPFDEIAKLVDGLPPSAADHRQWWENSDSHVQAQAWMAAGWEIDSVDVVSRTVRFRRTVTPS